MGWVSLSDISQWGKGRFAVEVGPLFDTLFSRTGRGHPQRQSPHLAIDGEIVVPHDGTFSFDDLLQRIHPAQSRVKKLAAETPALLIVFDLLADGDVRRSRTSRCGNADEA